MLVGSIAGFGDAPIPDHHSGKIPLNRPVYIKLIAQIAALPYQVVCAVVKGLDFRIRVSAQKAAMLTFPNSPNKSA